MVAACKVESESKEIRDKARGRAAVAPDPGEGTAELGQEIAKLMAALTKAGQGSNPSSAPSSPWERGHGRGCSGSSTPSCPNFHSGRSGPEQTTPAHSLSTGHGTGSNLTGSNGQRNPGTSTRSEGTANRWDPNSLQCFRCQGWGHMARECPSLVMALNEAGGTKGLWFIPPLKKLSQPTVDPIHSHHYHGQDQPA